MAVSFKVIDNRTSFSKKIKELEQKLDSFRTYFLEEMATEIIFLSPVDTGTYITSHVVSTNIPGNFTSSFGKPRNQDYTTFANEGLSNLYEDIAALPDDANLNLVRFTNTSIHASDVEYLHGYSTYTIARSRANVIAANAAAKAESR